MISLEPLDLAWNGFRETIDCSIQAGPFTIRISSTDAAFAQKLTRAFAHLPHSLASPDLTVRIWSGPKLPSLDWALIKVNGYRGYARDPIYFHYFENIHCLSAVDTERNIAYFIVRDQEALPWWVNGSPLQVILHVWFREKGMQLTHCASIGNANTSVLLSGKGGSGKSTTVLACLKEGLNTLGEDYILLSNTLAYSVYQTAKWKQLTRAFFPQYEKHISNPDTADQEKALVYYRDLFPSQIHLSSPVHAIVSLSIGLASEIQESDPKTSLQSLLLSTAMQLPHPDPRIASSLQEFTASMNHYHLVLGPDLKKNVSLIKEVLK
jgi:hypothetical protein